RLEFEQMIDQFADSISFFSCWTGQGTAGSAFVADFISSMNSVGYFKNVTTAVAPGVNFPIVGFQNVVRFGRIVTVPVFGPAVQRPGFFDLDATAACSRAGTTTGCDTLAPVPAPGSMVLLGLGAFILFAYRQR